MKRTKLVLLPKVLANLALMGENIKLARLRRNISMRLICERAHISRPTLMKVEQGSPDVSMGIYAAVLNALENHDDELAHILEEDELGRTIQDLNIKERKRGRR
ncbi:MAG: helix-turn-helix transcriptional regulator [Erysipelotrichaceae bacterium]|nr:helix-turn-helix transcriptional regulator [Erysipelotrichaceae bacterium]